ncbi:MAG TPA: hypothetical protein VI278_04090 [Nitrososphaeraceae archaeon]
MGVYSASPYDDSSGDIVIVILIKEDTMNKDAPVINANLDPNLLLAVTAMRLSN